MPYPVPRMLPAESPLRFSPLDFKPRQDGAYNFLGQFTRPTQLVTWLCSERTLSRQGSYISGIVGQNPFHQRTVCISNADPWVIWMSFTFGRRKVNCSFPINDSGEVSQIFWKHVSPFGGIIPNSGLDNNSLTFGQGRR